MRTSLATFLSVLGVLGGVARAEDGKGLKILVLNVERVIDETEEGIAFVKKLRNEKIEVERRLNAEVAALQEKQRELAGKAKLVDRDEAFYAELDKAMAESARIEKEKRLFLIQKSDEISRAMRQLMLLAIEKADEIRRARGAEVVLASRTGPLDFSGDQDFQQETLFRRVLCASPECDITDAVIAAMNEWYKENRRADETLPERREGAAGDGKGAAGSKKGGAAKEGAAKEGGK